MSAIPPLPNELRAQLDELDDLRPLFMYVLDVTVADVGQRELTIKGDEGNVRVVDRQRELRGEELKRSSGRLRPLPSTR